MKDILVTGAYGGKERFWADFGKHNEKSCFSSTNNVKFLIINKNADELVGIFASLTFQFPLERL